MDWYYAANDKQQGPVDQAAFRQLVADQVVTRRTLVWRKGMSDWLPYGEVGELKAPLPAKVDSDPGEEIQKCRECDGSFKRSDLTELGGEWVCEDCERTGIQSISEPASDSAAAAIRHEHLKHEASIRSIGILYFLVAVFMFLGGLIGLAQGSGGGLLAMMIGAVMGYTAAQIRKLSSRVRNLVRVLSGVGLLVIPLGTLINAYVLYRVFSQKGRFILSDEYRAIIDQTPHIKDESSRVLGVLLWFVLGLLSLLAFAGVFSKDS
jgi:hypothetical protein